MPDLATAPDAAAPAPWDGLRVVLVHDWLTGMRGGEKVLEALCRIFPGADILTLVHAKGQVSPLIEGHRIRTSMTQTLPQPARLYRNYLPLFPSIIEMFDLDAVDLIVSTSHCAAKSVVGTGRALHICYCHSPMRYAWDQFDAYFGRDRLGPIQHALMRRVMAWLARWDRATAHRVHRYVANSHYVAGRIARYYGRAASVLHPPVDTAFYTPDATPAGRHFLAVSALVPYKRLDIAIEAANQLGATLRIVGDGPDRARLEALAGPTIEFLGTIDDVRLREEYRQTRALVLPAEEDFGIAPVESLACGRPVVALRRGGATDSISHEITGLLVDEATPAAFAAAMTRVDTMPFDRDQLRTAALAFGPERFEAGFRGLVTDMLAQAARC